MMDLEHSPFVTFFLNLMPAHPACLLRSQYELQFGYHLLNALIIWYYVLRV